jgi:magnesium-transporting ATPase (P-type)
MSNNTVRASETEPSKTSDLEKMILLAESVSARVHELKMIVFRQKVRLVFSLLGVYLFSVLAYFLWREFSGSLSFFNQWLGMLVFLGLILSVLFYVTYSAMYVLRSAASERRVESMVLHDLLSLLFETMNYMGSSISPLERALLDIRLKRIRFSSDG